MKKITYEVHPNKTLYYSNQFNIEKIFKKMKLVAHFVGNDCAQPINNPEISASDVIYDLELNTMIFSIKFKNEEHKLIFIETYFEELSPLNEFSCDEDIDFDNSENFNFNLLLFPVDFPYNGG